MADHLWLIRYRVQLGKCTNLVYLQLALLIPLAFCLLMIAPPQITYIHLLPSPIKHSLNIISLTQSQNALSPALRNISHSPMQWPPPPERRSRDLFWWMSPWTMAEALLGCPDRGLVRVSSKLVVQLALPASLPVLPSACADTLFTT